MKVMRLLSYTLLVVAALAVCLPARGQRGGGPPPGVTSTPQPTNAPPRPDSVQDSGLYGYWTAMTDQGRSGGALLGKVSIEGQPLLWEPVLVSVVCKGKVVNSTATNPKGEFAFTSMPGTLNNVEPDFERQMEAQYEGCGVTASLAGFRADTITITVTKLRDDPNLGTIVLHANRAEQGTAISGTTAGAPKKAAEQFQKAYDAMRTLDLKHAQSDLEKATQIYPNFAEAWYELGRIQTGQDNKAAQEAFSKATAADPQFVLPYEQLAALAAADQKWPEALSNSEHVLQLDPDGTAQIWYFDAMANYQLGHVDSAKQSAEKSLTLDPRHTIPNTEQLLAVILAREGDYAGALAHLRSCLTYLPKGPSADLVNQQIAQLERAATKQK